MKKSASFQNKLEHQIAKETLERYSGSHISDFQEYLLLTNFSLYIESFAKQYNAKQKTGSMFSCAHSKELNISILDFKLGSPSAALTVDLCSFLPQIKASLMLGLCGGLRSHYQVGDYFVPVASIRGEGTSNEYFPPEVPALANFVVQKATTNILEDTKANYYIGITHTTNLRFWEFNEPFRKKLYETKAQTIEMECATLFASGYKRDLPVGALLLISDLPFKKSGIKTKASSKYVSDNFTDDHIKKGVLTLKLLQKLRANKSYTSHKHKRDLPHMEIGEEDCFTTPPQTKKP